MKNVDIHRAAHVAILGFLALSLPHRAAAQEGPAFERIRVYAGPEIGPAYPGAENTRFSPFIDFSRARGDEEFAYEAPDEGFGIPIVNFGGVYIGPVFNFTGKRSVADTAPGIAPVKATVEAGLSVQANIGERLYGFTEVRRGVGGHDGWVVEGGVDYILRDQDKWLVSIGPRIEWGNGRHQRAYFGLTPQEAAASGLQPYPPDRAYNRWAARWVRCTSFPRTGGWQPMGVTIA